MADFILKTYCRLLTTIQSQGFIFQTFEDFLGEPEQKAVVMRHDVDKLPQNALKMARLESGLGVVASYYFRVVPESFDEQVMKQVAGLGHEVGYHYEDLSLAKGDPEKAIRHFKEQLERFRRICPVTTICMHGSPLSRFDNRDLWKHYDYRDFGIIGEPYFDVDFNQVFYITDTGRKWNNEAASVRDRVESGFYIPIKSTFHLMALAEQEALPDRLMINAHPHRWFDFGPGWVKEFVGQNIKNVVKTALVKSRK